MHFGEILALMALGFGALLGLGGLFAPDWAARVVRLQADPERPGGYSELRATYGGLFLMLHMAGLVMVLTAPATIATIAVMPLSAAWLGAALGRGFSMVLDRKKGGDAKIIPLWMAIEVALGLAIAAPILQFTA